MGFPKTIQTPVKDLTAEAADLARDVIRTEIAGLTQLHDSIGPSFARAVDMLIDLEGRAIVTGMGKSGHIARKIAGTLASTGTPAQFVHPAEASHGDLGMITQADLVIALSNSGDVAELADIIAYTRRFRIRLIAMTAVETSQLATAADLVLLLPQAAEACPLGLAPTTSTTMMLAMGDALAVALLDRRGFGHDEFSVFHPGGRLGRGLLRVSSLMHTEDLPLAQMDTPLGDVILTMTAGRFGCAGIVDDEGKLAGIVTDGDLRRRLMPPVDHSVLDSPASRIMTRTPRVIAPEALAGEALSLMNDVEPRIQVLFVVEQGLPIGIIGFHDLLNAGIL